MPHSTDPRVIVDFRTSDDAGVFAWENGPALVQTVDFFTPIVDDPYVYGQIAAANALSDVYAMGGKPLTAMAKACFPKNGLDPGTIEAVFRGGHDKLAEAGVALLGGHTVQDPEIKFGYAVTGAIDPARVWRNGGARVGDRVLLTTPIGTGVVGTALKRGHASAELEARAVASMVSLNKAAAEALSAAKTDVHACTDVTGFGLAGHGSEVAAASGVTLVIEASRIPVFEGVLPLVAQSRSGGMSTNRAHFGATMSIGAGVAGDIVDLVFDPQTSGGLLVLVAPEQAAAALEALARAGITAHDIGHAAEKRAELVALV